MLTASTNSYWTPTTGLDERASALLNATLILVMANHIGDARALRDCIQAAKEARQL